VGRSFGEACSGRPPGFVGPENRPSGRGVPPRCCARGGGGPKMRHLVLYKLAGFFHADKTPCACFFPGAMLVDKSQKNTVFKKKVCFFGPKTPLFGLFVHFFAQICTLGGTSVHFRKIAKIAKFPNLARVHFCTHRRSLARHQIFLFT
jgi:hypothetical protein